MDVGDNPLDVPWSKLKGSVSVKCGVPPGPFPGACGIDYMYSLASTPTEDFTAHYVRVRKVGPDGEEVFLILSN